jgi:UDP-N-acetylmuramate-alanine ligase
MPGEHNVQNALAAVAAAQELEIPFPVVAAALAEFLGVARRFEVKAVEHDVVVVDDYGHHPTEIAATLRAAAAATRPPVVIFQPHTRTQLLLANSAVPLRRHAVDVMTSTASEIHRADARSLHTHPEHGYTSACRRQRAIDRYGGIAHRER